ncbi:TerB family tellurite resistance protein [Paracoccus sp. p4-l81]|uniref:tellurite resistance TerB family protein n=1 Tax=unclassified Paracoccus (in: a-proteobacteria) TaxID=2688777 RepID=UPI0035B77FFA
MFASLLNQLLGREAAPDALPGEAAEQALAALLVRVARADGHYDDDERAHLLQIIASRNGFSPTDAEVFLAEAEAAEARAADTVSFTRDIKAGIPLDERAQVLRAMWSLALADANRDPDEDQILRLTAGLLGLTDRDSALARQQAAADLGLA